MTGRLARRADCATHPRRGRDRVLIALSVWQVQRLDWKEGLIAELEGRLAAAPVSVPAAPDPDRDSFLRVRAEGRLAGAPVMC